METKKNKKRQQSQTKYGLWLLYMTHFFTAENLRFWQSSLNGLTPNELMKNLTTLHTFTNL
jgi:hypothetical protein